MRFIRFKAEFGWSELIAFCAVLLSVWAVVSSRTAERRSEATMEQARRDAASKMERERRTVLLQSYRIGYHMGKAECLLSWANLDGAFQLLGQLGEKARLEARRYIQQFGYTHEFRGSSDEELQNDLMGMRLQINDMHGAKARQAFVLGNIVGRLHGIRTALLSIEGKATDLLWTVRLRTISYGHLGEAGRSASELGISVDTAKPESNSWQEFVLFTEIVDEQVIGQLTPQ